MGVTGAGLYDALFLLFFERRMYVPVKQVIWLFMAMSFIYRFYSLHYSMQWCSEWSSVTLCMLFLSGLPNHITVLSFLIAYYSCWHGLLQLKLNVGLVWVSCCRLKSYIIYIRTVCRHVMLNCLNVINVKIFDNVESAK